jgi:hypothetical protein
MSQLTHKMGGDSVVTNTEAVLFSDGTEQFTAYLGPTNVNAAGANQKVSQTFPSYPTDEGYTAITYDTLNFTQSSPGNPSMWATGNNTRMTAPVTGIYDISASLMINPPTQTEFCGLFIRINGNDSTDCAFTGIVASTADIFALSTSVLLSLNAGDYVEAVIYNDTGGNVTSFTSNNCSQFSMALL